MCSLVMFKSIVIGCESRVSRNCAIPCHINPAAKRSAVPANLIIAQQNIDAILNVDTATVYR